MLRLYDKHSEQLQAGVEAGQLGDLPWYRVEIQARKTRASALANAIVDHGSVGIASLGVIRRYLQFREPKPGDSNKARWPIAPWWDAYLSGTAPIRIGGTTAPSRYESSRRWLERQAGPTMAMLMLTEGGEALIHIARDAVSRLTAEQLALMPPSCRLTGATTPPNEDGDGGLKGG